jgi:hypothetical protein
MEDIRYLIRLARDGGSAARAELDRDVRLGRTIRICTGAYVASDAWDQLGPVGQHLAVAHAAQLLRRRRLVFSHWTAVAAWGFPVLGALPEDAHVVAHAASGGRTDERLVRHCTGLPAATATAAGLEVTTPARSVVDLARVAPFEVAVVVADAALRAGLRDNTLDREALVAELDPPGRRGAARARRVVGFADALAASPGESVSRTSMALGGIPDPVLQFRFDDWIGAIIVDFWWPQFNLVGEFDGRIKYEDPTYLAGRTPQQALRDEKAREDRIRALGPGVSRWGWDVAISPGRLRAHLVAAGIRPERYRNW